MKTTAPDGLQSGGRDLWAAIIDNYELDAAQAAQLLEACRQKDRCDHLDSLVLNAEPADYGRMVKLANETANQMKQMLAALRLPDEATGKRPQFRGARGAQKPSVPGGNISSLDRARAAKGA